MTATRRRPLARAAALALLSTVTLLAGCDGADLLSPDGMRRNVVAPERHPIVFVHGFASSGSVWSTMSTRFKADGWTDAQLHAWSYNTGQSNASTAKLLAAKVDSILAATGASKVDVISHSMGGLSSRYYARNLGGDARIDAWVSLGGPNHGTQSAFACFTTSCVEMRPGSTFLKNLNAVDETPGTPRYATWWSDCDGVISPTSSTPISGASNTKTACLSHSALYSDATVYGQVKGWVHQ